MKSQSLRQELVGILREGVNNAICKAAHGKSAILPDGMVVGSIRRAVARDVGAAYFALNNTVTRVVGKMKK